MTDGVSGRDDTDSPMDGDATLPIELIVEELRELRKLFDSKIRYDEVRESLVQSMSDELAQYRQGFYQALLRPVLLDLVSLYDDITQVIDSADTPSATASSLVFFRDTVEEVLVRNGVEKFTVGDDTLDRARQRVLNTVDTPDPALQRKIARRLRVGFAWDSKTLRPEWVSVYRQVAEAPIGNGGAREQNADLVQAADTVDTATTQDAANSADGASATDGVEAANTEFADHTEEGAPS